jgi:hypothetical protein
MTGIFSARGVDGDTNDPVVLLPGQIWCFAGGPAHDQGIGARLDLPIAKPFKGSDIDLAAFVEWRRQGRGVAR